MSLARKLFTLVALISFIAILPTNSEAVIRISIFRPLIEPNDIGDGDLTGQFVDDPVVGAVVKAHETWTGTNKVGYLGFSPEDFSDRQLSNPFTFHVELTVTNNTGQTWQNFTTATFGDPGVQLVGDINETFSGGGLASGQSFLVLFNVQMSGYEEFPDAMNLKHTYSTATSGGGGGDSEPVPEPASVFLVGAALLIGSGSIRKRK